jgi:Xaa-Pro aminopeptidase
MSWPVGATNLERAVDTIERHHLDALVAVSPENARHLSGVSNFIASRWRTPGLATAVVARNGDRAVVTGNQGVSAPSPIAHFTYPLWIDNVDVSAAEGASVYDRISAIRGGATIDRPAQFILEEIADAVIAAIQAVSPQANRIGIELASTSSEFLKLLTTRLPATELIEASHLFDDLRTIKEPWELDFLRDAGHLTEAGIAGAIAAIKPGMDGIDISLAYQRAILDAVADHPNKRLFNDAEGLVAVGSGGPGSTVAPGITIKFDQQVDLGGYHSDVGRTVALEPTQEQLDIYEALFEGLDAALQAVQIGDPLSAIYNAGAAAVRRFIPSYSRGHLGHGVGLTTSFEEAPFITANEHRPIAPGMALSIEMPLYLSGVGSFQLESMVLIHEDRVEQVDTLALHLDLNYWQARRLP